MKKIHWRPIDKFLMYWISSDGKVLSFKKTFFMNLRKIDKRKDGYLYVGLRDSDVFKMLRVNRLVAFAFCKPKLGCDFVGHRDNKKDNNSYCNLYWCTHQQNMRDAVDTGRMVKANRKLNKEQVFTIKTLLKNGYTQRSLSKQFNVSKGTIQSLKENKFWRDVTV